MSTARQFPLPDLERQDVKVGQAGPGRVPGVVISSVADALEVHVTMPDAENAQSLARALVDEELAACVTIVPGARSIYRYEGQIHEEDEVVCFVKTHPALFERLRDRILALHPYDVPEILAFKVHDGSRSYLDWLHGNVQVTER